MKRTIALAASLLLVIGAAAAPKTVLKKLTVESQEGHVTIGTARPEFGWQIDSKKKKVYQKSYRIVVSSSEKALSKGVYDLWDSGEVAGTASQYVQYGGEPLQPRADCWWKVIVKTNKGTLKSAPQHFSIGLPEQSGWAGIWIGGFSPEDKLKGHVKVPARYLRKGFKLSAKVEKATLYICGLGSYEAYINGQKVGGDQVLSPTVSDYDKTVYYNTFDVTDMVSKGNNAIGVILEGGRYTSMRIDCEKEDNIPNIKHYDLPKLVAQLEVTYKGGKLAVVATDQTWKISTDGPIRYSSEFDGEFYDARMDLGEFATAGFKDKGWKDAVTVSAPLGKLTPQPNPNIAVQSVLDPVSVTPKDGKYIVDMGENMVGRMRMSLKGTPGDTVIIRYAETLDKDGNLYRDNLRKAEVTDYYIVKDESFEWAPTFTYHGFRYAEVSGVAAEPAAADFKGEVFYDRMATTGSFETSNEVINRIYLNAVRGIRGNYRGMPTDCPQRDERMGWLGDRTNGCYGEAYIFDNHLLYSKWDRDIAEAQKSSGSLPNVAPVYWDIWGDNITWPAAFVTVADMLYRQYGDIRPMRDNYDAMKKWLVYMKTHYGDNGIITKDVYGDWCMPPESLELIHSADKSRITEGPVLSTAFYYYLMGIMGDFARTLGKYDDMTYFASEAEASCKAFNDKYFHSKEGYYSNNTVTANILPLWFGMVPKGKEKKVFAHIVDKTEKDFDGHVSVGVVGIMQLMRTLTEYGRLDLAYKLASQTSYPSWGYMAEQGATTIWELWNGNTAAPAMNSGNHVMIIGDLVRWFYEYLAGIRPLEPGFRRIELRPCIPEGLEYVNCSYESVYGRISSSWKVAGNKLHWEFTIPANTSAVVYIPGKKNPKSYSSGSYSVDVKL